LSIENEAEFVRADIRVMIFGQETNDWKSVFGSKDFDYLMALHRGFSYHGPFWEGMELFKKMLNEKFSDKRIAYLWNNIVKIGKAGMVGMPPGYIYSVEREFFSVIKQEVEIIKPDIILFLTSPEYDDKILDNFPSVASEGGKLIAKVSITGVRYVFRTYHPAYLILIKKIYEVFWIIIGSIEFDETLPPPPPPSPSCAWLYILLSLLILTASTLLMCKFPASSLCGWHTSWLCKWHPSWLCKHTAPHFPLRVTGGVVIVEKDPLAIPPPPIIFDFAIVRSDNKLGIAAFLMYRWYPAPRKLKRPSLILSQSIST
jgi:hypothetical protein